MTARLAIALEVRRVPQAPLVRAAANSRFAMTASDHPADDFEPWRLAMLPEPHLIIVAANRGPDRTVSSSRLLAWCSFVVVHAVLEQHRDYEEIAALVPQRRKMLLIETTRLHSAAWVRFVAEKPSRHFLSERTGA